jgi:transcription termination/antitermination protein NusG
MAMAQKWYLVHAHSGFEKRVAQNIKENATKKNLEQFFGEVVVPTESIMEVKKGKKVNSERKFFPGYVMVQMEMNDATWQVVKNTPRVTGFLGGGGNKPQPMSASEVDRIFKQVQDGVDSPKSSVQYHVGDMVKVVDGPFESFVGSVEDVDEDKNRLKVAVSIFGRSTPVELAFSQVEKQ